MRHGIVLIVVLIVTVALAAGLTALLSGVRGQSDAVFAIAQRQQQRLAARSVAYALAEEFDAARDSVLGGEMPELSSREVVIRHEDADGWAWAIVERDGEPMIEGLGGLVDANAATEEMLRAYAPEQADRLIEARPIRSPGALRGLLREGSEGGESAGAEHALTLLSLDPQVRSGAGGPAGSRGSERVGVESGAPVPTGLSNEGSALFTAISDGSWRPSSLGHVLREAETRGIPQEDWDLLLDAVFVDEVSARRGLIDLNRASAEAIASLPGMDLTLAGAIVDRRESISLEDRAGLTWPVREGVVELDVYADVVDMLTVRSMQIAVRFRVEHEREEMGVNEEFNAPVIEDDVPALEYYGIVDLAGGSARFVYLRDVTYERWQGRERVAEPASVYEMDLPDAFPESIPDAPEVGGDFIDEMEPTETPESQEAPGAWGRFVAGRGA